MKEYYYDKKRGQYQVIDQTVFIFNINAYFKLLKSCFFFFKHKFPIDFQHILSDINHFFIR